MSTIPAIHGLLSGQLISKLIGWTYFTAWSISFYPQAFLNYRRKSVQGLSMDFLYYNIYGFFCYSIFNVAFFFSEEIQREYRERNNGAENLVRANDVFFAVHAFTVSGIALWQTWVYKRDYNQKVSPIAGSLILTSALGIAVLIVAIHFDYAEWIDLMYYLSYIKLGVSFVKYVPQVYLNYQRQSTVGWSIYNILLDFTGGALSISQLLLDAHLSGDWSGVSGRPRLSLYRL
ncbi:PQ loop repeat-domain-containing protein [Endogone sp. FLAS-F59071]|nr:PQ loop repeat-domain-containing protein [Endogone sp. FLAS-F59071]|eukprot:RUS18463.1 PQ loop repeat-domain-containing protein [Endogone sp. FLAS-F59071]